MRKWLYGIACLLVAVTLGIAFFAGCSRTQQASTAKDRLEVRNNGTAIQWKYSDDTDWNDLVSLAELSGAMGENGADGKNGIDGIDGKDGTNGIDGKDGINGKTVKVQKADLYIQWCYEGEDWQNLVALADITGPSGQKGADGANGKTPEFRVNVNTLQWRYAGDEIWLNLYDLSTLQGLNGKDGINGEDGKTPFIGENGNWWIGENDTGVKAAGTDGIDGKDGINGKDGATGKDGINGTNGEDGKTPFIGENGNWWIGENDTGVKAAGTDGIDGKDGINGKDGAAGKDGINGTNGEDGKTPFIGENGNWWIGTNDTGVKAAGTDGIDGKDGINGKDGAAGKDGKDGKDGACAGYFAASGKVYSWRTSLPFTVKKESGNLISYNSSSNKITLSKGHTYSLVFSGTVTVSAKGDDKSCGASLIDGYNSSEMALETRSYVIIPKDSQSVRLTMSYNTIYTAEEDITLTFQYIDMLFQDTNFNDSQYSITIIALD